MRGFWLVGVSSAPPHSGLEEMALCQTRSQYGVKTDLFKFAQITDSIKGMHIPIVSFLFII